jgi:hypothetical protein
MGYNKKLVVLLTLQGKSSKKKKNLNIDIDRLSVEVTGFVMMRV